MIKYSDPFDHWIIDNFLDTELASDLSDEFLDYNDPSWFCYNNPLENKKTNNNWYFFPSLTYKFISSLNTPDFLSFIGDITNTKQLYPDHGLHGAGWHIHGRGGKLNLHFDYSIHPKLHLQRKFNVIIYLSKEWDPKWGGGLQLWSHNYDTNKPDKKITTIDVKFNRAIIFDTTQHSWHGFPDPLECPENIYRKSIAMYYLCEPSENIDKRKRALYAPSNDQLDNKEILDLIIKRSI